MSDSTELATDGIERAHHAHEQHNDAGARRVAILISALAAALALAEIGEKGAQNAYLTHHIAASDEWAFYQAKTLRSGLYALHAEALESQPNAADPAVRQHIEAAHAQVARLDDDAATQGRKQLAAKAHEEEQERDHDGHRYHKFELVVGALQIGIVLASVSVVTRMRPLALTAAALGGVATVYGLLVAGGIF
jgi:hypothetical protein